MNQTRVKNFIEVASNVAVVVAALVVVASFARSYFRPRPRVMLQGGLQKGAQLPQLPGLDFSKSRKTLLVAMDANCDSCRESLPFFSTLVDKLRGKPGDARLIAMFQGGEEQTRRYAEQSRLNTDTVFGVDFKLLDVSALPSIILIDSTGTVLDFWIGKLSKDSEEQILKHLTASA
jgi:hypothetical protein